MKTIDARYLHGSTGAGWMEENDAPTAEESSVAQTETLATNLPTDCREDEPLPVVKDPLTPQTDTPTAETSEWRNLEPCEIIQEGDEVLSSQNGWIKARRIGQHPFKQSIYRTRRIAHKADQMTTTDTPRTDAAAIESDYIPFLFVELSFAKQLEIELNQFRDATKMVSDHIVDDNKMVRTDAASFSSRDPLELMKTSQQLERELAASKAEVERLKQKVAERDQLVKTSNILSREEGFIMQRWKDWGITKQEQLKRAVEIAEAYQRGNSGLHYQCNCQSCQMFAKLKGEIK